MNEEEQQYLWERRHRVLHRAELSALYHRERERFLSFTNKLVTAIAIIGGSTAYASVTAPDVLKWSGFVVAISATVSLVFGLQDRARLHGELAARFTLLLSQIAERGERGFSEDDIQQWESRIFQIETDEPPALHALVRICQNRLKEAAGDTESLVAVPFWRRWLAHIF